MLCIQLVRAKTDLSDGEQRVRVLAATASLRQALHVHFEAEAANFLQFVHFQGDNPLWLAKVAS